MNRPIPGTVEVAVRHILSDKVTGFLVRTRSITWKDNVFRVRRPGTGKQTVELTCPVCDASLLAEVRTEARARRTRIVLRVLAALCLVVFFAALAYAVHEGGRTLPEGQSLPTLFPISIVAVFVTFAVTPALFIHSRVYNGVSLLDAPKPRRRHSLRPVKG
ncbi:hypothetical protein [Streptomyces humi]|uniref:hypothetical protein n=1 Tax=Streptomyces humi TaxID=1428620 RepID=UPI0006289412|nr:hypothetical protein [Streptomyces humi]